METANIFIPVPSEWLLIVFLIFMGGIFWSVNKATGFQVLFLTVFSMSIAHIITLHIPYFHAGDELLPFTHPNIQAVTTFFAFFIPLARNKTDVVLCMIPPALFSIMLLILTDTTAFSIAGGVLIGGFIVYTFYRSLDWIGGMPELYLIIFSILLPLFLAAILYPVNELLIYPGILLGTGIGVTLESIKIKMDISRNSPRKRFIAFFIGSAGILLFYGTDLLFNAWVPLPEMTLGIALGLWITILVPVLLILLKVYKPQTEAREL
ncbi:hypothetical protein [Evansella clarkii]|uniref:hypothetical protein n=1 Tax=Evansella clarkii TaxID=79879 RepID=UPI000996C75A|nr:hypothetical protein [Evansella clarkii]